MQVLYKSTRGKEQAVTASMAILKGLSEDGGLFVPESIPQLDVPMDKLAQMTYQETAYEVMSRFLTDFTEDELKNCINKAYDSKFDTERSRLFMRRMGYISWNCSMARPLHLRIWHFPFFRI